MCEAERVAGEAVRVGVRRAWRVWMSGRVIHNASGFSTGNGWLSTESGEKRGESTTGLGVDVSAV